MTEKNGPWTINSKRVGYENPWVKLEHHDVLRPDGEPGTYGVVRFANYAVGVLPLFEDGTVPLVGQHRFPFNAYSWELPEGGGPKHEEPIETAHRELAEETGLRAENVIAIGQSHLSNSVTDEKAFYFLAWGLTEGEMSPDPDEVFEHRRIPLSSLIKECMDGTITDALTILMVQTAILKAQFKQLPNEPSDTILSEYQKALREV